MWLFDAFWRKHFAASFGEVPANFQFCGALVLSALSILSLKNMLQVLSLNIINVVLKYQVSIPVLDDHIVLNLILKDHDSGFVFNDHVVA